MDRHHLVGLVLIDDEGSSPSLSASWETEPGTEIRPRAELPDPADGVDAAGTFAAFDAARWGAVASADPGEFQPPFRAGIDIEDYQSLPLAMALRRPGGSLLIADDVGPGKPIEAGLVAQEPVLRNQVRKMSRTPERDPQILILDEATAPSRLRVRSPDP